MGAGTSEKHFADMGKKKRETKDHCGLPTLYDNVMVQGKEKNLQL